MGFIESGSVWLETEDRDPGYWGPGLSVQALGMTNLQSIYDKVLGFIAYCQYEAGV